METDPRSCPNFRARQFEVTQPRGGTLQYPMYEMGEEGFMLLAMGFTGRKALALKLAFLAEFKRLRAELQAKSASSALPASAGSYQHSSNLPVEQIVLAAASFAGHLQAEIARALLAGQYTSFEADRFLVTLTHYDARGWQPYIKRLSANALCMDWDALVRLLAEPGGWRPSDVQLADMLLQLAALQAGRTNHRAAKALQNK